MAKIHPSGTELLWDELRGQLASLSKSFAAIGAPATTAEEGAELRERASEHFRHAGIAVDFQTKSAYLALAISEEASARVTDSSSSAPAAPVLKSAAARVAIDQADAHREAAVMFRARASLAGYDSATILQLERSAIAEETRAVMLERSAAATG